MIWFGRRNFMGSLFRGIVPAAFALVLYVEYALYWFDTFSWPNNLQNCGKSCTKLLIVADPQLLGYENEPPVLEILTRWDSDRYIEKSFSYAARHVIPDAVLFLGDLFDEGSTSSEEDYSKFKVRFNKTFSTKDLHPKMIYIPGDNDIGGEGSDPVTDEKVLRFSKAFPTEEQISLNTIKIIPVNKLLPSYVLPKTELDDGKWRVVLSHIPVTYIYGPFSSNVMETLKPHAIFSAHEHKASMAVTSSNFNAFSSQDFSSSALVRKNLSADETVEIIWPTCSYRMGVAKTAYGAAIIYSDGRMDIAMLWLHSRFKALAIYSIFVALCLVLFFLRRKRNIFIRK